MGLAVPGRTVSILVEEHLGLRRGRVHIGGIRKEVCLDYISEARVGDYVMIQRPRIC